MSRDPERWAALSYAVGPVSGIIVLTLTKNDKTDSYVRFHAWQSVLVFAAVAVISMLLPSVPIVGDWGPVRLTFFISVVVLYVFLIIKALQGERHKLPLFGDIAANLSS